ncbi:MAG: hypothetical protein JNM26_02895, partial [Ideonella sp.]|nr:hypothetical protein [Ideonella sp.]
MLPPLPVWLARLNDQFPLRYAVWAGSAVALLAAVAHWVLRDEGAWLIPVFLFLV